MRHAQVGALIALFVQTRVGVPFRSILRKRTCAIMEAGMTNKIILDIIYPLNVIANEMIIDKNPHG